MRVPNNYYELMQMIRESGENEDMFDIHKWRRLAEAVNGRVVQKLHFAVMINMLIAVMFLSLLLFSASVCEDRGDQIKLLQQRLVKCQRTTVDSIKFDCLHCGWEHRLSAEDTFRLRVKDTITRPKKMIIR